MIQAFSFTEQFILNLVGPLVTIIIGGVLVGGIASRVAARKEQERREVHALRERLITQAMEGPIAVYEASQRYLEARDALSKDLAPFRAELDKAYIDARAKGELMEQLLLYHFQDSGPAELAHRLHDLMMGRYYQLREEHGPWDRMLQDYPHLPEHTGLTVSELRDPQIVRLAFREAIQDLRLAVTHGELTR
jgi:hypothetical protein